MDRDRGVCASPSTRLPFPPTTSRTNCRQLMQTVATATGNSAGPTLHWSSRRRDVHRSGDRGLSSTVGKPRFQITPRSGLAPGTTPVACASWPAPLKAAASQIGNSPLFLPYTITVRQDLEVTPAQDNFTGPERRRNLGAVDDHPSRGCNHIPDQAHQPERHLQHRGCHRHTLCESCCVRCLRATTSARFGSLPIRYACRAAPVPIHGHAAARRRSRYFRNASLLHADDNRRRQE